MPKYLGILAFLEIIALFFLDAQEFISRSSIFHDLISLEVELQPSAFDVKAGGLDDDFHFARATNGQKTVRKSIDNRTQNQTGIGEPS